MSITNGSLLRVNDSSDGTLTLQDLNDEEVRRRLPPMIYLGLLILIGLPGNITVLVVYATNFKPSTHRTFILTLAMIDSVACAVCMPFEIIEMNFQYTFYAEGACKCFRFINTVVALGSNFVLLFLSIDRYQRVCHPFKKHMTVKLSAIFSFVAVLLALLFSWPTLFLIGTRHVELRMNITGYDCSTSDVFRKTRLLFIYNSILFVIFIMMIVTLVVLYVQIGRKVMNMSKFRKKCTSDTPSSGSLNATKSTSLSDREKTADDQTEMTSQITENSTKFDRKDHVSSVKKNDKIDKGNPTKRITKIAFMISLTFILSYLPYLILTIITVIKGEFIAEPGPVVSAVLPIISRMTFINNVANVFIFGFNDRKFRECAKPGFKRLYDCS